MRFIKQSRVNHKYARELKGISKTRLYIIWSHMKQRCYNEKHNKYQMYGAKGIKVCDEWLNDFMSFRKWALENGYRENLTLDRIDGRKGYEPSNCRWRTYMQQANNMSSNHFLAHNGETHTISEWSRIVGIKRVTIERRINKYGWSVMEALTVQPKIGKRKPKEVFDG